MDSGRPMLMWMIFANFLNVFFFFPFFLFLVLFCPISLRQPSLRPWQSTNEKEKKKKGNERKGQKKEKIQNFFKKMA